MVIRRRLVTDDIHDRAVEAMPTRVIVAYGDPDVTSVDLSYHRGRRTATILDFSASGKRQDIHT
jgi:hypothetical protein